MILVLLLKLSKDLVLVSGCALGIQQSIYPVE